MKTELKETMEDQKLQKQYPSLLKKEQLDSTLLRKSKVQ